jgi:type II secretory pathway component PulF
MPVFTYRAVDAVGRRTQGRVTAATDAAAARELETRGLLALDLREGGAEEGGGKGGAGGKKRRALLEFTRGMAALLPAGMPLSRALAASMNTSPKEIHGILAEVQERVQRGDTLSTALGEHPELFSPLYVGIVRAGEQSGSLDSAFIRLTSHLERDEELSAKLISSSIYPIVLAVVGIASVLVLLLFVLPRFAQMLEGSGSSLPRSTAIVMGIAEGAKAVWPVFVVLPFAVMGILAWMRSSPVGRRVGSSLLLGLPVVGGWRRQALAARFARMAGELVGGGVPLLHALRDTAECMGDPTAQEGIEKVRHRVREGSPLHRAVAEIKIFPPELWQLIALGEESGRLADFLLKGADFLERRTERSLERMVSLVGPVMIVIFGGIVALVALSLLQAIYGINPGSL